MGDVVKFQARRAVQVGRRASSPAERARERCVPFSLTAHMGAVALVTTAQELWLSPEQARLLARELVRMAYYADGCTPEGGS